MSRAISEQRRLNLVLSSAFDLITNIEYCHDRVVNARWIYCNRTDSAEPRVYYSFLKQCPRCCQDKGLEKRLERAQHKPSSHHIGEITTIPTALILRLIAATADKPLTIGAVAKQSADVDLVGFRPDLLVLFEVKSSPMVTYPLCMELDRPMYSDAEEGIAEYAQHSLVDVTLDYGKISLYIPHRDWLIPLSGTYSRSWPYPQATDFFANPEHFLEYLSAWLELFYAYSIPKTQRTGKDTVRAFLTNGWGDEIDSNKTKPGLGRTDDMKKGTYQLLKFGSYYRDEDCDLPVRSALVANLDPLFMRGEYLDELLDIRWGKSDKFIGIEDGRCVIEEQYLHYLYEGIFAFNNPVMNDPMLKDVFDFANADRKLLGGGLDSLLEQMHGES